MISDVVMPGISGRELANQLSQLRPQTKVLFLSGYTEDAIVHHGVLDPGTAFLQKPFTVQAMVEKVRSIIGGARPDASSLPSVLVSPPKDPAHNHYPA